MAPFLIVSYLIGISHSEVKGVSDIFVPGEVGDFLLSFILWLLRSLSFLVLRSPPSFYKWVLIYNIVVVKKIRFQKVFQFSIMKGFGRKPIKFMKVVAVTRLTLHSPFVSHVRVIHHSRETLTSRRSQLLKETHLKSGFSIDYLKK